MIAAAVRAELARRKMTVAELARQTAISQPNLQQWLSGERGIGIERAEKVLAHLGLAVKRPRARA